MDGVWISRTSIHFCRMFGNLDMYILVWNICLELVWKVLIQARRLDLDAFLHDIRLARREWVS